MMDNGSVKKTLSIKKVPEHIQKLQLIKKQMIEAKELEENKQLSIYEKPVVAYAFDWLYATFEKSFIKREQKPLKINILDDIFTYIENLESLEGIPSKRALKAAIATYVRNRFYLKACVEGASRIDLEGNPVSLVIASEAEYAKNMFEKFDAVYREKRKKLKKDNRQKKPKFDNQYYTKQIKSLEI
ncbi:MAG: ProQ/FinO family protein [Proteobacteria bacterium]|nr:ProQ/FinO family protein [Pseudomonadota bacterium]